MSNAAVLTLQLRRMDTSQPWGFRMRGGAQQGQPLIVDQCGPKGRAGQAGLCAGDIILAICNNSATGLTHDAAKGEILRAGNELDLTVQRSGGVGHMVTPQPAPAPQPAEPRVQVVEEHTGRLGGPTYKQVQTKTMSHLEHELPAAESGGSKPASIFDRKRRERSEYLQAKGPTIQKAFGQTK